MKKWILKKITGLITFFISNCRIKKSILLLSSIKSYKGNLLIANKAIINRSNCHISGLNNKVFIKGSIYKSSIKVTGTCCSIIIEENAVLNNTRLVVNGNNCSFFIGKNSTIGNAFIVCMGESNSIKIGEDCMLSEDIDIWASDSHPIFDTEKNIINPSKRIVIENHVWLGKDVKILKGVIVGKDSIVGMGSIVTKDIPPSTLNVGIPAKVVRRNINWDRHFINV